jgi:hypothetical protein
MPPTTPKPRAIPDARLATLAAAAPLIIAAEQRCAAEWRALIEAEWSGPLMTLTAGAYFIATAGAPINPEEDVLEAGAMRLLDLILTGGLTVFARRGGIGEMVEIPFVTLADATQGSVFFAELPPGARPRLVWAMDPDDGPDVIATRDGVLWGDLSVMKADLIAAMEPESVAPPAAIEPEPVAPPTGEQPLMLNRAKIEAYVKNLQRKSHAAIEYILDKWPNGRPPMSLTKLRFELKQYGGVEDITEETLGKHLDNIYGERGYFGS